MTGSHASDFSSLGLDARLVKAVRKMGLHEPTPVQERCIPLALEGKDLLARAPTGSGKTVAYAAPMLQQVLTEIDSGDVPACVRALILVPTRELCNQVHATITALLAYAGTAVRVAHVAGDEALDAQKARLAPASLPHVLIATPARLLQHLRAGSLSLASAEGGRAGAGAGACGLATLVVDEADLLLSYGYGDDLSAIAPMLPPCLQSVLVSATLTPELDSVTGLLLHNPLTVDVGGIAAGPAGEGAALDGERGAGTLFPGLSQYVVECKSKDKLLLIFALLKLNRIPGRSLVFCNEVPRAFRLKLFLEQFGVHAGVLNSELPLNSRWHMIQAFNRGTFDFLIATDDPALRAPGAEGGADGEEGGARKRKRARKQRDASADAQWQAEFGVSRGVDFQGVTAVINFDPPSNLGVYQHRIGRTARGGLEGTAITFIATDDPAQRETLGALRAAHGAALQPLQVEMSKLNSFRYRVDDATRAVTRAAVQEARMREVRNELLNSERLRAHFEDNPHDLNVLQHDRPLATVRPAPELKLIPKYLLPDRKHAVDGTVTSKMSAIASAARKRTASRHKLAGGKQRRKKDPLKSLSASKNSGGKQRGPGGRNKTMNKRTRGG